MRWSGGSQVPEMLGTSIRPRSSSQDSLDRVVIPFEIIGVLEQEGRTGMSFMNPDEQILIPLQHGPLPRSGTDRLRTR